MKDGSSRWLPVLVLVGGLAACSETTGPDPDPDPEPEPVYIGSTVAPGTANVLSAVVTVNGTGFDEASLVIRTAGEADIESPPYPFDGDFAHPAALGMLAETTYDIDVLVTAGGVTTVAQTLSFTTGALPDWIPPLTPVGTAIGDGLLLLTIRDGCDGTSAIRTEGFCSS